MTTQQGQTPAQPSALGIYRVLDLTEGGSNMGPRLLADMGADVLRIEPPEGSPTRKLGPFLNDTAGAENSLFWRAYNFNKRGITLGLETVDGRELFTKLVKSSDMLFESFPPGYLASLGLDYEHLATVNPRLIMASITPFGQTGPYAHWQGPDLVVWAMGGYQWMCGDPDRPPVRISIGPQAFFHASVSAAVGSLMALQARYTTGRGQYIDQAAQHCPPWMLTHTYQFYEYQGVILRRAGQWREGGSGATRQRTVYLCKDGYVIYQGGGGQPGARTNRRIVELMDKEGLAPDWLKAIDWATYDMRSATQQDIDRRVEAFTAFFQTRTKAELLELAVKEGMFMAPVNTFSDMLGYGQLQDREFWARPPDSDESLSYPGAPFKLDETPWRMRRHAPRIGEHNRDVYCGELGLAGNELEALRAVGAV